MYFNGHLIDKYIYIVTFKDKFFSRYLDKSRKEFSQVLKDILKE